MITRLLVANRGEIARRVFATCRRLDIATVAVHSDVDADLPFVREADVAVRLPGNTSAETYLRADLILDAARRAGADAIHPGYGFLSENAKFARAVLDAGLVWVGPTPESIERMGSKVESKRLMTAAGVPILTTIDPAGATVADLPLLVKASAGGGGRGMRTVRELADLPVAVESASAEAVSAFGDGTVFVEPYVEEGRHVEVQVVGHRDGVLVLGERDCSIQRRHQKVVEETPAPLLPEATRQALHDAARVAAAAIDYRGAGTVEFLYDASADRFFFLEMNTRLQVEHPVTELVHGVDLVELQVRVAEGETLSSVAETAPQGHAVEVRLYAEDSAADYQPQSGVLTAFEVPHDAVFGPLAESGVRVDSGFGSGDEVSTFYDAMLAKVVAWAPTRESAVRRLSGALRQARLHGLCTNRDQLLAILAHPAFVAGEVTTSLLSGDVAEFSGAGHRIPGDDIDQARVLFAAAVAVVEESIAERTVQQRIPAGWRNVYSAPQVETFEVDGAEAGVEWRRGRTALELVGHSADVGAVTAGPVERIQSGWRVAVDHDGLRFGYDVRIVGDSVDVDGPAGHVALTRVPRYADPVGQVRPGSLLAPMPGSVVAVRVADGATVEAGQALVVLEAMKMQHTITAAADGVVTIVVTEGQQVAAGDVLAIVAAPDPIRAGVGEREGNQP